ncbi:hypothetical protein [Microbacterium phyllosphaerae]|uniref:hypothetical protein n=1 Tax=Microbacterium phyllosphaerae TaxID=124798 RepID=UPI002167BD2B|nr:hypothetical protein [Microbacterium phyllosphaerae]MCS3442815.1 hypothetical protein [Microbacterium phyllosphaerae]
MTTENPTPAEAGELILTAVLREKLWRELYDVMRRSCDANGPRLVTELESLVANALVASLSSETNAATDPLQRELEGVFRRNSDIVEELPESDLAYVVAQALAGNRPDGLA